ncbi:MAG: HAMP domain-containing histidine kinase [Candidatus Vogelbacteria bacterium]|nr:HAMP domain-containing histidine kinase [Candidatus Vogelbacteria bacterium]
MATSERSNLIDLGKTPINPLVFWGVVTLALVLAVVLVLSAIGLVSGVYLLLLVPVGAYLVIMGVFIGYLSKLYRERSRLMTERIREEEARVGEFKKLNQELEAYAKQLFDKDFELTLANKRLQNLEQAKSKFVSVTTHQLRTPLAAIKWTFHMLLGGSLGPVTGEQRDFLQKGYDSTQRIIAIINDLLNVDYIEADKSDYNFLAVNLAELIEGVIFEFINLAESKKIKLDFIKPSNRLPPVAADPVKISMVLENLIDNALKYTLPAGRVTINLSDAKINSARSRVEVVVVDTGIGVSAAEKDKIFHRFFRGANAIQREPDGTGLGLFIARDIIEKHGGEIWFESREGEGTNFHFTLPIFQ